MIVRQLEEIQGTEREMYAENWVSRRLLLSVDGMGFSLHDTIIHAGTETMMWYKHHLEAVYCIEGEGEIESLSDGKIYAIRPGTMYALNMHDRHVLRSRTSLRMVCVFNPPCTGNEVHDKDGAYRPASRQEADSKNSIAARRIE
ncbi:ectoine synthase [Nitrosomonas communis]|uniref:ectoine synthase n=1 Tax=Nitrosomonas communis TaxID=44574 RepID=UPI0026EC465B|nr:ectoine synthase [Nitrosomonas communis]MCO6427100.1 ectoine synthase [Nitrosomonas communis]